VKGLAPEALELLLSASWPGNVRQLYNVIEQSVALATTPLIPPSFVQQAIPARSSTRMICSAFAGENSPRWTVRVSGGTFGFHGMLRGYSEANARLVSSTAMPPPSAMSVVPFTNEDSSEARNKQHAAISSAVPARRIGTSAVAMA